MKNHSPLRVLLVGGAGYVGRSLATHLVKQGHEVRTTPIVTSLALPAHPLPISCVMASQPSLPFTSAGYPML